MEKLARIWWEDITGPQYFLSCIISLLSSNKHVLLSNILVAPWKEHLRTQCNATLSAQFRDIDIKMLDAKDIPSSEIGLYLLKRFCGNPAIRNAYRPSAKKTIGNYLIENKVLLNKIFWVKDISPENLADWIKFLNGCASKKIQDGLFVLEVNGSYTALARTNWSVLDYTSIVREYDHYTFICQLLSQKSPNTLSFSENKYVAAVTFGLCGRDIETAVKFLDKEPGIILVTETERFIKDPLFSNLSEMEIANRLWLLQVKELFPLLEMERVSLLTKYYDEFTKLWNNEPKVHFNQQGEARENIDEFEIGEMDYYVSAQQVWMPDENDRKKINKLRSIRNKLAHHKLCTQEEVRFMLDLSSNQ